MSFRNDRQLDTRKANRSNTQDGTPKTRTITYRESQMQKDTIEDDALVIELYNEAELLCILDA